MWLTENSWFDRFIMLTILINSVSMGLYDYETANKCLHDSAGNVMHCLGSYEGENRWNYVLLIIGQYCGLIFIIEAGMKIFARGFVNGHKTYLRSAWNCIDLFIVFAYLVELLM